MNNKKIWGIRLKTGYYKKAFDWNIHCKGVTIIHWTPLSALPDKNTAVIDRSWQGWLGHGAPHHSKMTAGRRSVLIAGYGRSLREDTGCVGKFHAKLSRRQQAQTGVTEATLAVNIPRTNPQPSITPPRPLRSASSTRPDGWNVE